MNTIQQRQHPILQRQRSGQIPCKLDVPMQHTVLAIVHSTGGCIFLVFMPMTTPAASHVRTPPAYSYGQGTVLPTERTSTGTMRCDTIQAMLHRIPLVRSVYTELSSVAC